MIIVTSFKHKFNPTKKIFTIISVEKVPCPLCGGVLCYRDKKLRKLKNLCGKETLFKLNRFRCAKCKTIHTEIPGIIQPYKHYDSKTIQRVLDGDKRANECAADDSTIRRWKKSFAEVETDIAFRAMSVSSQAFDERTPTLAVISAFNTMKISNTRWLAFVMKLLINSGYRIFTQFAFCQVALSDIVKENIKKERKEREKNDKTIKDSS